MEAGVTNAKTRRRKAAESQSLLTSAATGNDADAHFAAELMNMCAMICALRAWAELRGRRLRNA